MSGDSRKDFILARIKALQIALKYEADENKKQLITGRINALQISLKYE